MMGWLSAFALAGLAFLGLWRSGRCPRLALELAAVAILIALAGYSWQGTPDMPGRPVDHTVPVG